MTHNSVTRAVSNRTFAPVIRARAEADWFPTGGKGKKMGRKDGERNFFAPSFCHSFRGLDFYYGLGADCGWFGRPV